MSKREQDKEVYELLVELDRLEELREQLEELGLSTIDEIEERIDQVSAKVEQLDGERTPAGESESTDDGSV